MNWDNPLSNKLCWSGEIKQKAEKEILAETLSNKASNGDVIGAGSGSTSLLALAAIGRRVKNESLKVAAIPTSREAELNCRYYGLRVTSLLSARPDWGFDGADEVDPQHNLIKGRGGALFMEKLVMASSPKTYILADEHKLVRNLGEKHAVPVEIDPRALHLAETRLQQEFNTTASSLRMAESKDGPVITEAGNFILDVTFKNITHSMEKEIKGIPGVIETGLFFGYSVEILTS
ncbi:ribose 5-phosphate isomerase A [Halobacillus sp. Marseille-P3879]|uniref:ribose 5-phosphate isomerase A n=1 Tax=Halobacillus sp. Marseille-P3879 TaxID=2045014 RepID=UPI000C7DECEC|nr:ribose 5-phosphate isomerase A [Halobacillus sp. Marseille-P3879]